jgi:hypothetical protein
MQPAVISCTHKPRRPFAQDFDAEGAFLNAVIGGEASLHLAPVLDAPAPQRGGRVRLATVNPNRVAGDRDGFEAVVAMDDATERAPAIRDRDTACGGA